MTEPEKPLTLEEIAKIMETITEWTGYEKSYHGMTDSLVIHLWNFSLFSKKRQVDVYTRKKIITLGSFSGEEVLPLYEKAKELCSRYENERKQKRADEQDNVLKEIRSKIG